MMRKTRIIPPKQLNGYVFGKFIGQGSFASVYEATKLVSNQKYAIKIFPKQRIRSEKELRHFQHEIDIMAYFKSPYIVHLFDFFYDPANFYLVFDLCKGGELFDYIIENDKIGEKTAATIFKQVCLAISYSHSQNVAHRDIKPQNILITEFPSIKVADFGLCGYISPDFNLLTSFCGSPLYLAPECMKREDYDGKKSDIWSMGVLLYTMVVGKPPWDNANIQSLFQKIMMEQISFPSHVSKQCKNLISMMLKVNPTERASMEEILSHPWLEMAEIPDISKEEAEKLEEQHQPLEKPSSSSSAPTRILAIQKNKQIMQPYTMSSLGNKSMFYSSDGKQLPALRHRAKSRVGTTVVDPMKRTTATRSRSRTTYQSLPYVGHF